VSEDIRYPVGRFQRPQSLSDSQRIAAIDRIAATPAKLRDIVRGLNDAQLDTRYRADGWTVRQVVHHVPDSHANAYTRFKLALTEDTPTIKPYDERAWANLDDVRTTPIETSLVLLESLHDRWVRLLRSMSPTDFDRLLKHPDNGLMNLHQMLALYAWHGEHHVAHVANLRSRSGWV
jgi:DinB superfamily